jgi:serine/threonine protein kinase
MPRSKYWTAPEWHEREFLPIEARRMDSYSFGMLCLWLLFYNNNASGDRDFEMDIGDTSMEVLDHALRLIETITCPELQQSAKIQRLLSLTLAQDPRERTSDFSEILQLLSPNM